MSDHSSRFFIDRRLNPSDRSLANRQRFLRRARAEIKGHLGKALDQQGLTEDIGPQPVTIPAKSIREPRFRLGPGGDQARVLSGNKQFVVGDRIKKPGGGGGGSGSDAGGEGSGVDDFTFVLTRQEFLDLIFEDLALPDLVATDLQTDVTTRPKRAGHTGSGTVSNLDVARTMRRSFGRRLALGRPSLDDIAALEARLDETPNDGDAEHLEEEIDQLRRRWRRIPYIDPSDVRFRRFDPQPEPSHSAVMFCLMDVSASMNEQRKELAKRFFLLLHLFLRAHYEHVDVVFIRHTHEAEEVDEETFFHGKATGGTTASSALLETARIIDERYPTNSWNIYIAQASDGDNGAEDTERCVHLLDEVLLPITQFFAYIEVTTPGPIGWASALKTLGPAYALLADRRSNLEADVVAKPGDIYPVFRKLFHASRTKVTT